jgi:hypothetical protein
MELIDLLYSNFQLNLLSLQFNNLNLINKNILNRSKTLLIFYDMLIIKNIKLI